MADRLEDLLKSAVQGKPYSGENNSTNDSVKIERPMILKHSSDSNLGKPMMCNEGTDSNNINNDFDNKKG